MKIRILIVLVFVGLFSCKGPTPRKPIMHRSSTYFKESVNFNKTLNAQEELAFKVFMENDSVNNYYPSPNGFWHTIPDQSAENNPQPGDEVIFSYEVFDLEMNEIYSFEETGEKRYFVEQQEIEEGLRLGLKMMNEGESEIFLFPSHLMFGYLGDADRIGINQPLIFTIRLDKINRQPKTE